MRTMFVMMLKSVVASFFIVSFINATPVPAVSCSDVIFPGGTESCRDYWGDNWNPTAADADCGSIPGSTGGILQVGMFCDTTDIIGTCVVDGGTADETRLYFYSGPADLLEGNCVNNMNGEWLSALPTGSCDHLAIAGPPGTPGVPACKQYSGSNWDETNSMSDCEALDTSVFNVAANCQTSPIGYCTVNQGTADEYSLHYFAGDAASFQAGCEGFLGGVWIDAEEEEAIMQEAVDALVSNATVTVTPNACDEAALAGLVANNGAIEFAPTAGYTKGLIIYPGGSVDPRAYAVAARMIAEQGFLVTIIPFPGNIAITDPMRANYTIMAHPEVAQWAIAGHSLGGVTASIYASANPFQKIKAIAFWDAYAPEGVDLSQTTLKGLSITVTERGEDGDPYADEREAALIRQPAATYNTVIRGGNHAQFGYYGVREGDGEAKISYAYQHELFTGATVHLLNRIGIDAAEDVLNPAYASVDNGLDNICVKAQKKLAGFKGKDLKHADITNVIVDNQAGFQSAKPFFPKDSSALISVATYAHQVANSDDIHQAPIYDGEVWCKMKTQDAIAAEYGFNPVRDQKQCAAVNETVFEEALTMVDPVTADAFLNNQIALTYIDDFAGTSGPEWLGHPVTLSQIATGEFNLEASNLVVPNFVPAPYGGAYYCKVWSPLEAVQFIVQNAE